MAISDIVQVDVSLQNGAVSQDGFGTPLIAGFSSAFPVGVLVQTYNTATVVKDMIAAGFTATDPMVLAAGAVAAQSPAPTKVKVGKLSAVATQRVRMTPTVQSSTLYSFKVKSPAGVVTTVSFTSAGGATASTIAVQAIALLPVGFTGADQTTYLRITAGTPGQQWSIYDMSANWTFLDDTVIAGSIAAELAAIAAVDNDWYALVLSNKGLADALLASAWIETQAKIMVFATQDTDVATALTTDIATTLKNATRMRTALIFVKDVQEHGDAAFLGKLLPYFPGSETWKFKTLANVTVSDLSATQRTNLVAKNSNFYETVKGRSITGEGKVSGGEWIDAIRLRDAIQSRVGEEVLSLFLTVSKVAFTDAGIASVEAATRGALQAFTEPAVPGGPVGLLSFTTSFPKAKNVSAPDKAARRLTGCAFTATLSGAIHFTQITGTLSV